jgi:hypothetical protein
MQVNTEWKYTLKKKASTQKFAWMIEFGEVRQYILITCPRGQISIALAAPKQWIHYVGLVMNEMLGECNPKKSLET